MPTSKEPPHPRLLSYGSTLQRDHPLILVIGREPNTSRPIVGDHGTYDFDEYPRCAFWNVSYSLIGEVVDTATRELKSACRRARSSPIVYGDALPIGLPNHVRNKADARRSVVTPLIEKHVGSIFAFDPVISRTRVVLLSGLEGNDFARSRLRLFAAARDRAVPAYPVPFFFGNNSDGIRGALNTDARALIRDVMRHFLDGSSEGGGGRRS